MLFVRPEQISQMGVFDKYIKKPIPILAKQMDNAFSVDTLEGKMEGKSGDYLIIGIKGELYPCDRDIFEKTYSKL
jgi:hypothetical protein